MIEKRNPNQKATFVSRIYYEDIQKMFLECEFFKTSFALLYSQYFNCNRNDYDRFFFSLSIYGFIWSTKEAATSSIYEQVRSLRQASPSWFFYNIKKF